MRYSVGIRIKTIRKRRGLTQEQLAEKAERSIDAISALERGKSLPSFETLERLANTLEVPVRDFFDFEEDGENPTRIELMARLVDVARNLSDRDLEIITAQAEAFETRRS